MNPGPFIRIIGVLALVAVAAVATARARYSSEELSRSSCARENPAQACETFALRAALGKVAENEDELRIYYTAMNGQLGEEYAAIMRSCFATVHEPQVDAFTLVGDITPEGKLQAVEVRPATNIASCFAAGLAVISFPTPPRYPGHAGLPLTIEMRIR